MARYTGFYGPTAPWPLYAACLCDVPLYLPILFIPIFSFNSGVYVKFPLEGFTFGWYADLFQREPLKQAFWNSVKVATFVSVLSTAHRGSRGAGHCALPHAGQGQAARQLHHAAVRAARADHRRGASGAVEPAGGDAVACDRHHRAYGDLPALCDLCPAAAVHRVQPVAGRGLGRSGRATLAWTFWRITLPCNFPGILACLLMTFTISFR